MRARRAGELVGQKAVRIGDKFIPEYQKGGWGVPDGGPMRPWAFSLPWRVWTPRYEFERPSEIIIDTDFIGTISYLFCGPYVPPTIYDFSSASKFVAEVHRRGQAIFINRPGEYQFYFDSDTPCQLLCRVLDAAFAHVDKPNLKQLNGYDPHLPGHRAQGASPDDPAGLWFAEHGGADLYAGAVAQASVGTIPPAGALLLPANALRKLAIVQLRQGSPPVDVFLAAVVGAYGNGQSLESPGDSFQIDGKVPWQGPVFGIVAAGNGLVSTLEIT